MKKLILLLCAVLLSAAFPARADASSVALVRGFYDQLSDTMKQGDQLGFQGRVQKLDPVVRGAFDLALMTRVAVGPAWVKASPEEQQKLVAAFAEFSVATYASRFTRDEGEKFEVLGEKPSSNGGTIVETKLTPKGGDPVILNYLVRMDDKGAPHIVDVFLDATISELATRRAEFGAIVKRDGVDGLVSTLSEKAKKMGTL